MRRFPLQFTALASGRVRATDPNSGKSAIGGNREDALQRLSLGLGDGLDVPFRAPSTIFIPPSSEPISSPAETKAADAPPPASAAQFKRTVADWRPHCLKPDACGSSKLAHCRTCAIAAGELEAA